MNYKHVLFAMILVLLPSLSFAATLEWERNTEADMDHYNIYTCPTVGCTVLKSAATKHAVTVPQPPVGTKPSTSAVTLGPGAAAVTAVDKTGNESGVSNQASLPVADTTAPAVPGGLTAR